MGGKEKETFKISTMQSKTRSRNSSEALAEAPDLGGCRARRALRHFQAQPETFSLISRLQGKCKSLFLPVSQVLPL